MTLIWQRMTLLMAVCFEESSEARMLGSHRCRWKQHSNPYLQNLRVLSAVKWKNGCQSGHFCPKDIMQSFCIMYAIVRTLNVCRYCNHSMWNVKCEGFPTHAMKINSGSESTAPVSLNPLNAELNPICHFLALLGAHHILHVNRIRVNVCNRWR